MDRAELTALIVSQKNVLNLRWSQICKQLGASKEWCTAALLGQMPLSPDQARKAVELLHLPKEAERLLQEIPMRGSLPTAIPTDPTIYRLYEILQVYGTTIKELIHEEFGDGIMSAIDFSMDIQRVKDEHGDRVQIVLNGKHLKYKTY
ncbi:cyanase [Acidithiobacillus ferrivorans]|uniref:cyanase n=1 Tax=Acidithiobacillus ferrivorans TaxID=160808 RepID=UPI001C069221|nr:cyanase [Acidithiobacillus ferrivorans]MBU2850572.1 cyanase [Acidithiobacillus ferrivorans]